MLTTVILFAVWSSVNPARARGNVIETPQRCMVTTETGLPFLDVPSPWDAERAQPDTPPYLLCLGAVF